MPEPTPRATDDRYLRCHAGDVPYCALLAEVRGLRGREHFQSASAGGEHDGQVRTAGGWVPAFDLATLLGLPAEDREAKVFLVFGDGDGAWALGVEGISRPFSAPTANVRLPLLEGRPVSPFFSGAAWDGERLLPILNADRLRRSRPTGGPHPTLPCGAPSPPRTEQGSGIAPAERGGGTGTTQLVLFSTSAARARSIVFGLCLVQVSEILRSYAVWPLPGTAPYVRGLTRYGRQPVPVVDLGLRYGLGTASAETSGRLLLVRARKNGAALVAFTAGSEVRLQQLAADQPAARPSPDLATTPTRAIFSLPHRTLILPDVARLIQSQTGLDPHAQTWALAQKGTAS